MNCSCRMLLCGGMVVAFAFGVLTSPNGASSAEPTAKRNFADVPRPDPGKFKCLVVFGLYTEVLKLDDAIEGWKHNGRNAPEFTWINCPPNAVEAFPDSYDKLFAYNTIVLSDVNYKAIGQRGFDMLCDYVEQGGSLLVMGGPYAFGNGEFEGSRFLQVLPVTLAGPFDLKWAGTGKVLAIASGRGRLALACGCVLLARPASLLASLRDSERRRPRSCSKRVIEPA